MRRREMQHENKDYIQNGSGWYKWEIYRTFCVDTLAKWKRLAFLRTHRRLARKPRSPGKGLG